MIALGRAPLDLGPRRVVGKELGVDVELADPARDELGELAAEVEDDDGVRFAACRAPARARRRPDGLGRSLGAGCLERRLEVGLDLGVVGGEDPVAGVGDLAVDGLAALVAGVVRGPASLNRPPSRLASAEVRRPWRRLSRRLRIASAAIAK